MIKFDGKFYDYEVVARYFEDEIREALHLKLSPCTEQEFFDAYIEQDEDFMERYQYDLFPSDTERLKVIVTKINECKDTEVFEREIDQYDIENAVSSHGVEMKAFKNFTKECYIKAFKHVGSKTMPDTCSNKYITWNGDTVEITVYDVENIRIRIYFDIVNEDNDTQEIELCIDTDFPY